MHDPSGGNYDVVIIWLGTPTPRPRALRLRRRLGAYSGLCARVSDDGRRGQAHRALPKC